MNKKSKEIMDQHTKDGKVDWKSIEKDHLIVYTEDRSSYNLVPRDLITTMNHDEGDTDEDLATVKKIIEEQGYGTP